MDNSFEKNRIERMPNIPAVFSFKESEINPSKCRRYCGNERMEFSTSELEDIAKAFTEPKIKDLRTIPQYNSYIPFLEKYSVYFSPFTEFTEKAGFVDILSKLINYSALIDAIHETDEFDQEFKNNLIDCITIIRQNRMYVWRTLLVERENNLEARFFETPVNSPADYEEFARNLDREIQFAKNNIQTYENSSHPLAATRLVEVKEKLQELERKRLITAIKSSGTPKKGKKKKKKSKQQNPKANIVQKPKQQKRYEHDFYMNAPFRRRNLNIFSSGHFMEYVFTWLYKIYEFEDTKDKLFIGSRTCDNKGVDLWVYNKQSTPKNPEFFGIDITTSWFSYLRKLKNKERVEHNEDSNLRTILLNVSSEFSNIKNDQLKTTIHPAFLNRMIWIPFAQTLLELIQRSTLLLHVEENDPVTNNSPEINNVIEKITIDRHKRILSQVYKESVEKYLMHIEDKYVSHPNSDEISNRHSLHKENIMELSSKYAIENQAISTVMTKYNFATEGLKMLLGKQSSPAIEDKLLTMEKVNDAINYVNKTSSSLLNTEELPMNLDQDSSGINQIMILKKLAERCTILQQTYCTNAEILENYKNIDKGTEEVMESLKFIQLTDEESNALEQAYQALENVRIAQKSNSLSNKERKELERTYQKFKPKYDELKRKHNKQTDYEAWKFYKEHDTIEKYLHTLTYNPRKLK